MSRYYTVIIFLSVAAMRNVWRIICRKAKCGPKGGAAENERGHDAPAGGHVPVYSFGSWDFTASF